MPKISVVIPAYNSEKFIAETLDSLLAQTLQDIEVIIINDGSTDSTQAVIDDYVKKSDIFKAFSQPNGGVSAARNNGLQRATGEYVVFLDADDFFSEKSLEAFYTCAKKTDADIVMGRLCNYTDGKAGQYHEYSDMLASSEKLEMFDKRLLWSFLVGNKCYRREKLVSCGAQFPPFGFSEEGAFFMSVVYSGATMSGTTESCMYYRRHLESEGLSVSQTASVKNLNSLDGSMNDIYKNAKAALEKANRKDEDYLQEILFKYAHILVSQFYREAWRSNSESFALCAERLKQLKTKMSDERFAALCKMNGDLALESIVESREDIKNRPLVSVVVKDFYDKSFFDSLYNQSCPIFEVIVTEKAFEKLPEKYKKENLTVAKSVKAAKKAAKARNVIVFKKPHVLAAQVFKSVYHLGIPKKLISLFFPIIVRTLNILLTKRNSK